MLQTIRNAWKLPELRGKILFTLLILLVYRIGSVLPVPFIDPVILEQTMDQSSNALMYYTFLAGDAFSKANVFALSISPYITSSIVMQLLTVAIPALERMAKDGDDGRKKIARITRYVTVALGLVTAIGYYIYLRNMGIVTADGQGVFGSIVMVACYAAGAALIMWLAEKINENGIGNGISLILFANIVSRVPTMIISLIYNVMGKTNTTDLIIEIVLLVLAVAVGLGMVWFVVHMHNAERRIPVQYAKRQVGRRMYGGQSTYLPLKVNMTGVMPLIFASSIVALPTTIAMMAGKSTATTGFWGVMNSLFAPQSWLYAVLTFVLIIAFAYFYISISFSPIEVANNLKKNGGSIMGIRPGKPTTDYIAKILTRITLIGAIFLALIAVVPLVASMFADSFNLLAFGGSSIIIVVGVVIETVTEIETQMTMRHYKGFLE